jgi:hypothetical protein
VRAGRALRCRLVLCPDGAAASASVVTSLTPSQLNVGGVGTALATRPPAGPAKWAHRPDKRNGKADQRLKDHRDKPNHRGNGKSGTTKNTSS